MCQRELGIQWKLREGAVFLGKVREDKEKLGVSMYHNQVIKENARNFLVWLNCGSRYSE